MVTRKRGTRGTEHIEPPPEPIEIPRELGPIPPLSPIPDELDPVKHEAPPRASNGPDWVIAAGIVLVVLIFLALMWWVLHSR